MSAVPKRLNETEEGRKALEELALEMVAVLRTAEVELVRMVANHHLDLDEEMYVWGFLPSEVRSAFKRGGH